MTSSYTTTESWTRVHARRVGGKVAADLRQMQQEYDGLPTDTQIEQYLQELVVLLADSLLHKVTYGFKRNGVWIAALRYTADMSGNLTLDDRSGRIPRGVNITGASWGSFLTKSGNWYRLSDQQRRTIDSEMPFERGSGEEPTDAVAPVNDKTYSAVGCGLTRASIGGVG